MSLHDSQLLYIMIVCYIALLIFAISRRSSIYEMFAYFDEQCECVKLVCFRKTICCFLVRYLSRKVEFWVRYIRRSNSIVANLLFFMSCIESKTISQSMLSFVKFKMHMIHAIDTFRAYAFVIKRNESDIYDMHRLVYLTTKVWLIEHDITKTMHEKMIAQLT